LLVREDGGIDDGVREKMAPDDLFLIPDNTTNGG
jgi:hypothetical protein